MDNLYPYPHDPNYHPLAWIFFNAGHIPFSIEQAHALAQHTFDNLGCGAPGTAAGPAIKYDAVGGSGAPWEQGKWIPLDEPRAEVSVTAPSTSLSEMTAQERAELRAALDAADIAEAAGSLRIQKWE